MSDAPGDAAPRAIPPWVATVAIAVGLALMVVWSAWTRWKQLAGSPFPIGVDGYFYPIQLRSLLETGGLQYPSSPLTFWFMAPFAAVTDPITGAKLGAAIGGALVALPAYAVGTRLTHSRGAGMLAAAIAVSSACSAYLSIEFVKQGIGLSVALAALWLLLRAFEAPSRLRIGLAIGGFIAAVLAHKMAAAIVFAIAVPAIGEEARGRALLRGRRLLYVLIASVALGVIAIVLGLVMPERFLSPDDISLVGGLFSTEAHWLAPALATSNGYTLEFSHEAAIGLVTAIGAAIALRFGDRLPHGAAQVRSAPSSAAQVRSAPSSAAQVRPAPSAAGGERVVAWAMVALGIAIGIPWLAVDDADGLGYRLRLAAFVPLAMTCAIAAAALARKLQPIARELAPAGLAVIVMIVRAPAIRTEGRVLTHPALVAAVNAVHVPADSIVVVPERHLLFMVAWYKRARVTLNADLVPHDRRLRMMPMPFIGKDSPLDKAIDAARRDGSVPPPIGLHPRYRNGLVIVEESTWEWVLAHVPEDIRGYWAAWPPI